MRKGQTMTAVLLKTIKESGQSLYSIAKATGMQKTALGRFVAGKQSLRLDMADRLAAHFGIESVRRKAR
jgi:plasmid maintenance system antidote protein VapI